MRARRLELTEICYMPATKLAAAIRVGTLSPVEVTEAVLARIERINPELNAYCTITAEQARRDARKAEAAVTSRATLGPLHGVPFSLKDLTVTRGVRTTFGSKIFEHHVPTEDAILVDRLKAAGGILLGKTNTSEFGCKRSPTTRSLARRTTRGMSTVLPVVPVAVPEPRSPPGSARWRKAAIWRVRSAPLRAGAGWWASSHRKDESRDTRIATPGTR